MKGFIEVHEFENGYKILIAIGNISFVKYECDEKGKGCCKIGLLIGLKGVWVEVQETYEEVRSLIIEAQCDKGYVSKKALQKWIDRKDESCRKDSYHYYAQYCVLNDLSHFLKEAGV